jgi:hypothetical protein
MTELRSWDSMARSVLGMAKEELVTALTQSMSVSTTGKRVVNAPMERFALMTAALALTIIAEEPPEWGEPGVTKYPAEEDTA